MPQDIGDNRIVTDQIARIDDGHVQRLSRHHLRPGDIVYSRRGDVKRRALVRPENTGWLCGTGCLRVRLNQDVVDPEYASFYLGHPKVGEWIQAHAVGATMPNLNTGILESVPLLLPPLPEQRIIAAVLGALDDKIELNRKTNQTLEALARAIFQSWFVDFDPVHANAAGRSPPGMDPAAAALFPATFQDSPLGPVPEGWRVSTIAQEVQIVGGSTPSTTNPVYWEGGKSPFATPKDLSQIEAPVVLDTERHITSMGIGQISSRVLPVGTVLLSSRAPIGYLAVAAVPLSVNQGFIAMICDRQLANHYVRLWADANMDEIKSRANGTTFMEVNKSNFRPMPVLVPSLGVMDAFQAVAEPMFEQVITTLRETATLAATRDFLLPKLLSGQVRVRDAKRLVP